jgi:hypothetical protein
LIDAVIKAVSGRGHDHELDHPQKIEVGKDEGEEQSLKDDVQLQCVCCSDDPIGDLEKLQQQADEIIASANPGSATRHEDNTESLKNGSHSADKGARGNDKEKNDFEKENSSKWASIPPLLSAYTTFQKGWLPLLLP